MFVFSTALFVSILLLIFYIVLTLRYKKFLEKKEVLADLRKKEIHIEKFISEEKKDDVKKKLAKISQIISKTEKQVEITVKKKIKVAEEQFKLKDKEVQVIEKAGKEYRVFTAGYKTPMPKSDEELKRDVENLEGAIEKLESFDLSLDNIDVKKANVGVGVFYEKMSRKFNSIIKDYELDKLKIIPIQQFKYHAFTNIKSLKNDDFLPVLNLMQKTQLLSDIIEINPTFHILVFTTEKIELSNPEKVVLSFAYEDEDLTIQGLLDITSWDYIYANKIIEKLKKKEIIHIKEDHILIEEFSEFEERKKWNAKIEEHSGREKAKEQEKLKRQLELKARLKERLQKTQSVKIPKTPPKKKQPKIEDELKDTSLDEIEELPKIKFATKPAVKSLPKTRKKIAVKDKGTINKPLDLEYVEKDELQLKETISQKILSYHEKFFLINGGFSQFEKIKQFIDQEITDVPNEVILTVLDQLFELKLIFKSFKIGKVVYYLFKDVELNAVEKKFIKFATNKKPLNKINFLKGLKWNEEKVLSTMKSLQEKGILRIEANNIIIPGIVQKM
jgi:hypothetical protein